MRATSSQRRAACLRLTPAARLSAAVPSHLCLFYQTLKEPNGAPLRRRGIFQHGVLNTRDETTGVNRAGAPAEDAAMARSRRRMNSTGDIRLCLGVQATTIYRTAERPRHYYLSRHLVAVGTVGTAARPLKRTAARGVSCYIKSASAPRAALLTLSGTCAQGATFPSGWRLAGFGRGTHRHPAWAWHFSALGGRRWHASSHGRHTASARERWTCYVEAGEERQASGAT
jgi:hypothetical protein